MEINFNFLRIYLNGFKALGKLAGKAISKLFCMVSVLPMFLVVPYMPFGFRLIYWDSLFE